MSAAFRALPDVEVPDDHAPLELGPKESLLHGVLANGMTCAAPCPPSFASARYGAEVATICTWICTANNWQRCNVQDIVLPQIVQA